ncbi:cation-translocating P-type ATPase [Variovorax sp. LjRoot290]|uniref:heavy metal translocating P-type ATPase n=1 Tax=Variovorax sp. LjRoot290 TaxID=3342316 RepID=UPI003ED07718
MQAAAAFSPPARHDPTSADLAAQADCSLLDDATEWPAFGRSLDDQPAAGRWESQVVVEGMHCAACAFTVEATLAQVPGVEKAEVNAATRRARIVWSAAAVTPSRWFAACAAAGYRLVPAGDMFVRARRAREARLALWRWLVAGFCMMQVMMYAYPAYIAKPGDMTPDAAQLLRWASWVLTLPVILFSCGPFFRSALLDLRHRRIGMDLPVALGIAITFVVSTAATFDASGPLGGEVYFDSLTMFVFFLLTGRWLETRLRDRTAGALEALMNRLPDSVERLGADGMFTRVAVRRLAPGDIVRVLPGEAFPADGILTAGDTTADEALLTGESRPVPRPCGTRVLAGSHNLSSAVQIQVESLGQNSRFAQIMALMESASLQKPRLARLADRAARPFLVAVLAAAFLAGAFWWPVDSGRALMVAVAVLIVTCPCALSLATPAAMLASAGFLARRGVVVRNLQALEALASVDTVVFDKTGTLTRDVPRLDRVYCRHGMRPGDAVELAAAIAAQSLHPAGRALVAAWSAQFRTAPAWEILQLTEYGGLGLEARVRRNAAMDDTARCVRLGSAAFCGVPPLEVEAVQVHLSDAQGWLASFVLAEDLRPDAGVAVAALQGQGLSVQLLSGDRDAAARQVAARCGIKQARGDCAPEEKLRVLQALQAGGRRVAMVGDGLNDGPILAHAHVSFAFGNAVPLAQARADFVVLGGSLAVVAQAVAQARRTLRVVRQNLRWAAGYNALCVPLAVAGWLPAWLAGLGMAASSLLVVLNAARLARPAEAGR